MNAATVVAEASRLINAATVVAEALRLSTRMLLFGQLFAHLLA